MEELERKFAWSNLGEEGHDINKILAGVDPKNILALLDAWEEHLEDNLTFPFEAEVDEFQERRPLRSGDRMMVTGIADADDLYGLIVHVRVGRRRHAFPLCDLAAVDEASPNHDLVQLYRVWFANR